MSSVLFRNPRVASGLGFLQLMFGWQTAGEPVQPQRAPQKHTLASPQGCPEPASPSGAWLCRASWWGCKWGWLRAEECSAY